MPLDPVRDLLPVTRVTTGTVLLIVNSDRPWKTFGELIAAAKRDPGKLTMGSGIPSFFQCYIRLLAIHDPEIERSSSSPRLSRGLKPCC